MVKTVRLGELHTARQRHRAVTEWRLLRALRHKHIARLVHVMRDTDTDYVGSSLSAVAETLLLVHEYCAGGSLEAYVTRYGALQERNAGRIVGQLNAALVHCHERQIFHRGVRAANVLLDASFRNCKLADFSSAVRTTSAALTAASSNELHYQAPELATGGVYQGAAADAWSLGVVGYYCLCGRLPFVATPAFRPPLVTLVSHRWLDPEAAEAAEAALLLPAESYWDKLRRGGSTRLPTQ